MIETALFGRTPQFHCLIDVSSDNVFLKHVTPVPHFTENYLDFEYFQIFALRIFTSKVKLLSRDIQWHVIFYISKVWLITTIFDQFLCQHTIKPSPRHNKNIWDEHEVLWQIDFQYWLKWQFKLYKSNLFWIYSLF